LIDPQFAIRFIENLKLVGDSYGEHFKLHPFQRDIICRLFAPEPRIREAFLFMPRSAAKTVILSGLNVTGLVCGKSNQELISAASTHRQAKRLHEYAAMMITQDKWLKDRCIIKYGTGTITYVPKCNTYQSVVATPGSAQSLKPSMVTIDELHLFDNHAMQLFWQALRSGSATRKDRLIVSITTAGHDRKSLCYEVYLRAKEILKDPTLDPSFLPILYEYTGDDIYDESSWRLAQPGLDGGWVDIEDYRRQANLAKTSTIERMTFEQLYLNRWVDDAKLIWLTAEQFQACHGTWKLEDLEGLDCYAHIDVAARKDLLSLCLLFPWEDGKFRAVWFNFVGEESAERRMREDNVPYPTWIRDKHIIATPGETTDQKFIENYIVKEIIPRFNIQQFTFDDWNATYLMQNLDAYITTQKYPQTMQYQNFPTREFERLVLNKQIEVLPNPVVDWCFSHCALEFDRNENCRPSRKKSRERIDPCVSAVCCLGNALSDLNQGAAAMPFFLDLNPTTEKTN
jgi:phage terminase large subunit-like protein